MRVENFSPLDPIKSIMCGAPGTEAVLGLAMPPEESLFETNAPGSTSVIEIRQEHDRMTDTLSNDSIQVFNMRQIIGESLARRARHRYETPELLLSELYRRAEIINNKNHLGNIDQIRYELKELLMTDVRQMGCDAAIAINGVLTNCIDIEGRKKPLTNPYEPAGNFLFWRDTNHITGNEFGSHKMFRSIRQQEIALAELGFEALGIHYQRVIPENFNGSIEGGDILPMELNDRRYALIGQAERTSWSAVQAWFTMHEAMMKREDIIPAVVAGPRSNTQDQMHLDTFCQQVAPGAIIHCGEITRNRKFSVLTRQGGAIKKVDTQLFSIWIEKQADHVYDMCRDEQLKYAPNFLVNADAVYITRDDTPEVTKFIRDHVSKVVLLNLFQLTKLYGGVHCSTSEIRKS